MGTKSCAEWSCLFDVCALAVVYVYVYMYVCICAPNGAAYLMFARLLWCMYVYMHVVYVCIHVCMYVNARCLFEVCALAVYMYICMYMLIYVDMLYVCVCVY